MIGGKRSSTKDEVYIYMAQDKYRLEAHSTRKILYLSLLLHVVLDELCLMRKLQKCC